MNNAKLKDLHWILYIKPHCSFRNIKISVLRSRKRNTDYKTVWSKTCTSWLWCWPHKLYRNATGIRFWKMIVHNTDLLLHLSHTFYLCPRLLNCRIISWSLCPPWHVPPGRWEWNQSTVHTRCDDRTEWQDANTEGLYLCVFCAVVLITWPYTLLSTRAAQTISISYNFIIT